jgi:hypothetical protein
VRIGEIERWLKMEGNVIKVAAEGGQAFLKLSFSCDFCGSFEF